MPTPIIARSAKNAPALKSHNCGPSDSLSSALAGVFALGEALAVAVGSGSEGRSEEHTSELQSRGHPVCRLLLEKKKDAACRPLHHASLGRLRTCRCRHPPTHHPLS